MAKPVVRITVPTSIAHQASLAECLSQNHTANKLFCGPAFANDFIGQVIQQLRVGGFFAQSAKIVGCGDKS